MPTHTHARIHKYSKYIYTISAHTHIFIHIYINKYTHIHITLSAFTNKVDA